MNGGLIGRPNPWPGSGVWKPQEVDYPKPFFVAGLNGNLSNTGGTFNNVSVGNPSPDRRLIIVGALLATESGNVAVSVGGNSATIDAESPIDGSNSLIAFIASIALPSGLKANIQITKSSLIRCGIRVYPVYSLRRATPIGVGVDASLNATSLSVALPVTPDGIGFASAFCANNPTFSWTGAVADANFNIGGSTNFGSGYFDSATWDGGRTVSFTTGVAATECSLAAASYR
mgnify:CR=1 FL=1